MYLSRPPLDGGSSKRNPQGLPKPDAPNVLRPEAETTPAPVRDRDDMTRHPTTKKFTSRWQNNQSDEFESEDIRVGERRGGFPKNTA